MDLEATLEDLAPRLLRYTRGLAPDPALAEEAAQEALTALVARWRRLGPPDEPAAFAFVVARRRLHRARWKRRFFEPLESWLEGGGAKTPTPSPGSDPENRAQVRQDLDRTLAALSGLPAEQREALLLTVAGEVDVASAASILGISRSAVKMRVHRARQKLLGILEKNDGRSA